MAPRCESITADNIDDILSNVENVLFDCDGTLWRGEHIFPGAVQLIEKLNALGKRVGFITNNACRSKLEMIDELQKRGFTISEPDLVLCTAHSTVLYLTENLPKNSQVFLVAPPSLAKALNSVNIRTFTEGDFDGNFDNLQAEAVVCSLDRTFNYHRFAIAAHLLVSQKECLFLATNIDTTFPEAGGRLSPDCGAIAAALSSATGREVDVWMGKPSAIMFEQVAKKLKLDGSKTLMVGDRCETDMAFASAIGAWSVMVLTGVSTPEDARKFSASNHEYSSAPHFIVPSVEFIANLLDKN